MDRTLSVVETKLGEKLLYVRMCKEMYGLLCSALLFYLKLRADLEEFGFKFNDYDPCVANKIVNGKQMTVTFHVDDLKVSHVEEFELSKMIIWLGKKYGNKLVVHRGDVHDYLGMDLDYSETGVVILSMNQQLEKVFTNFPEDIGRLASSPASDHLFQIRDHEETEKEGKFLDDEKKSQFHHTVAQLLFITCRVRGDIATPVAFLTTRVKKPDEDDWGKLKRVLKYLKGTKYMKLTLNVSDLNNICWWVDASYNTHEYCKGHTGGMMSLGKSGRGALLRMCKKQKLNVRSSCKGELVGINDVWCAPTYFVGKVFHRRARVYSGTEHFISRQYYDTGNN
jgi:hypothetical protein